jgi:Transposase C of IS166 homeodomain
VAWIRLLVRVQVISKLWGGVRRQHRTCRTRARRSPRRGLRRSSPDGSSAASDRAEQLTHRLYGPRSEGASRIFDQIELQLEALESSENKDEIAGEMAAAKNHDGGGPYRQAPRPQPLGG